MLSCKYIIILHSNFLLKVLSQSVIFLKKKATVESKNHLSISSIHSARILLSMPQSVTFMCFSDTYSLILVTVSTMTAICFSKQVKRGIHSINILRALSQCSPRKPVLGLKRGSLILIAALGACYLQLHLKSTSVSPPYSLPVWIPRDCQTKS